MDTFFLAPAVGCVADGGECGAELSKEKRRLAKKRRREEAVMKDVLAWSDMAAQEAAAAGATTAGDKVPVPVPRESVGEGATSHSAKKAAAAPPPPAPLTLYVSGLNKSRCKKCHVEAWLLQALGPRGSEVVEVRIVCDKDTGLSRGFGFVELATPEASAAVLALDGDELMGTAVAVRGARPRQPNARDGGDEGGGGVVRRFGSLDMQGLAKRVEADHQARVAVKVAAGKKNRSEYIERRAKQREAEDAIVTAGGTLPGGLGHGLGKGGLPKLHSGYSKFEL